MLNFISKMDSPTERDRSAGSTLRLHDSSGAYKSYRAYDPIPTPSPISPAQARSQAAAAAAVVADSMQRSTSLDSLHNSTENSSDDGDPSSDSDSIFGMRELTTGGSSTHLDDNCHRQSDLTMLKASTSLESNDAALQTYLENSHKKCDYKDCGYKKQEQQQKNSNKNGRRNSITSAISMAKMETILEEPIEAKVSVKEILARFETLREAAEAKGAVLSTGARQAAQTLNVPIEQFEATIQHQNHHIIENHHTNGHHHETSPRNNNNGQIDRHQTASPDDYPPQYIHRKNSLNTQESISPNSNHRDDTIQSQSNAKHSLLQFAIQHFRNDFSDDKSGRASEKRSSTQGRGVTHADLVKWQNVPLRAPLLRLPPDLSGMALECFDCILKYSGDSPMEPELTEVKCVYTILMHCHKFLALRDEVYCQLMKQTTTNRSQSPDSSQRAWRLLSILAAYFGCSDALKPYLIEHLTAAASDRRRTCHGTAGVCLANLRKTARCGGRKNVPSVEEVTAVSAGRSARRQIYRLPGGAERVVNTRCSTVVSDVIAELCALLGIESEIEQQEFSLYCIVQGDAFTMPLAADEYILDVTTELLKSGQPFYLIFCRSVWHFPLKRDPAPTPLYIEVLFNQVAPDYLEGLLLELPGNGAPNPDYVRDMARIAAILHRAADLHHVPVLKEIKFLLPKPALALRELRPAQWVALVQSAWPAIAGLSTIQVKAQFLNVLAAWPLFGSSFFAIKRVLTEENTDEPNGMWKELILALNRRGVLFLDPNTHETLQNWSYKEVISTRKVRSEDGALFLDMKVGNLLQQRIVRVQTEQAHEISRLVRQYITMAQIVYKDRN